MHTKKPTLALAVLTVLFSFSALTAQAKSTLWKISSKNGTLYIQGSAHVLKAENYPLAPAIEQAYSNSTALVLEVDMGEMMSPQTQQLIMGKAMLQHPDTLQTVLTPHTYASLQKLATDAGLPIVAMQQFKPWFATMTLTLLKMKKMGLDENLGLDRYFYDKAKADQKTIKGLESVDFQVALLDSLSKENPNDFVERSLSELEHLEDDLNQLLNAWEAGDLQTLETLINKGFKEFPGQYEKFITDRNKAWVKQLGDMLKRGETHMVVVGAGHLPGEQGVINLLKKKGYAIEQL